MGVVRTKLHTMGPVNIYRLSFSTSTTDRYPATAGLSDDRFFRLVLANGVRFAKTSVVAISDWRISVSGELTATTQNIWGRHALATEDTATNANLQGDETRFNSSNFWSPTEFPRIIIPPGVQLVTQVVVPVAGSSLTWEPLLLEALDIRHLIPFLGGESPFSGVSGSFGSSSY